MPNDRKNPFISWLYKQHFTCNLISNASYKNYEIILYVVCNILCYLNSIWCKFILNNYLNGQFYFKINYILKNRTISY